MAADLSIRIGAELTEIKGALAALRKDFASVGQAAKQAGGGQALQGIEQGASGAAASVGRLVASFATLAGAIKLIGAADELNTLNARIRLVTNSTEEYNRAQVALFDLAQRTRTALGETINLYARIANATKDAGVGQEVLLQVVETVNQAVQLSGASGQAAEAALVQLGQGLASGALRGEELNSILEQTPALADAIAKGLGKTRGELRQLGQDGKLSAQQVIEALLRQRDAVAQQFAQLPLTVGQASTQVQNAWLQLVGVFDQTRGATSGLAQVISGIADSLSSDRTLGAVVEFSATWSDAFRAIVADTRRAVEIIDGATSDIAGQGENLIQLLARAFREFPVNVRAAVRIVTTLLASGADEAIAYAEQMRDAVAAIFTDDTLQAAAARYQRRMEAINQARRESIDLALSERDQALADAKAVRETFEETRRLARRPRPDGFSRGKFKPQLSDAQKREAEQVRKAELDAQEKLTKDSYQRQLGILQEFYEDAKIAAADYFARRQALELEAFDRAIAIERQRAAAGGADRIKALAEIELLERQKGDVQRRIQREQAAEARKLAAELAQAEAQDLENQGRLADAARIRLEAQFRDLLQRLEAEGNAAGVRLIRGLIDTGVAKARFDELRALAERAIADLERRRAEIQRDVDQGRISPDQGRQQGEAAQADAVARLAPVNGQLQQLAGTLKDPALVEAANNLGEAIARIGDKPVTGLKAAVIDLEKSLQSMSESFAQVAVNAGVDAVNKLFTDLRSGTKSAGEALSDFVVGFAESMAQIATRALATYAVLQFLDAVYPGLGRTTAAFMGVGARPYHSGGVVGQGGGPTRQVPAWMFAGAPRYHSGGMVGLKAGEVPAILQTGEEVLSRSDPRNAANGGGGGGTRIVNVIDPSLVQDYMTSAAGERVILNVIERNRGAVRQKLV